MPARRRALRDNLNVKPLVTIAQAALRDAAAGRARARRGLERALRNDADCRIVRPPAKPDSHS